MATYLRSLTALALAATLMLGACGGGDDDATPAPNGGDAGLTNAPGEAVTLTLSAVDNSFSPPELRAPAGATVTVNFSNDGDNPHTFTSEDLAFDTGTIDPGGTASVSFTVPEDEVEFQCDIHAGSGMTGTIVPE